MRLPGPASSPAAQVFALVIGIDDYPGRNGDLGYAVADAMDMAAALRQFGVPDRDRLLITNGDATAGALESGLQWLVQQAGPEDTAVVFYAGHVRQLGGGTEAIITADGVETTDERVAALLAPLAAGKTWVVIAACYGGGFDEVMGPGRILTAAAPAGEVAFESSRYRRSYLAEYMIRRAWLERQAPGTVEDAFSFAVAALQREHPDRVPVQFDDITGKLAIGTSASAPPRPPSDGPPSQPGSPPPSPPPTSPPPEEPGDCTMWHLICRG